MKYNQEYRWFQWAYFALYFAFASLSTYMIPFLRQIGYDAIQRGIIFSFMALTSIVLQFLVGYFCDKFHIVKKSFIVLSLLLIVATFACYQATKQLFWMHLFLISAMGGIYKLNYNLLDSWSLLCSTQTAKKFGIMRAYGAVGFASGTYLTSVLVNEPDYTTISWIVLIATSIGMICCSRLPDSNKEKGWADLRKQDFIALWETKSYVILIIIFLCINIVGTADQYTTIDKMMHLEATKAQIGYKWAIQSLSEIPVFLLSLWLLRKLGGYRMMIVGTSFYILKFVCYGLAPNIGGMLAVTSMQTITYPLITLSSRTLFASIAKHHPDLKTSTQLIAASITLGVSALVAPVLCGFLVSTIGHDWTLYSLAAFLFPVLIYAIRRGKEILEID